MYSVLALCGAAIVCVIQHYGLSEKLVTTITVVSDPALSPAARKALQEFIQNTGMPGNCLKQDKISFLDHLSQTFGCIKNATITRKNRTHNAIKIQAHTPLVALNNSHVVAQDGLLIGVHFYRSDIVLTLPAVATKSDLLQEELCQLVDWVLAVPKALHQDATFAWKNPTEIELILNKYPQYPILITTETKLTEQLMRDIQALILLDTVTSLDARFKDILIATYGNAQQGKKNKNAPRRVRGKQ